MSSVNVRIPWSVKLRVYGKGLLIGVPAGMLLACEVRDMYYRATWQVIPVPPQRYQTGDLIAIANRWYTLPNNYQKLRSFLTKTLLKSVWDDIGVVIVRDGVPYILIADYDKVVDMPLEEFVEERKPRGVAWRKLNVEPNFHRPTTAIAELFSQEVKKIPTSSPWYLFDASWRTSAENTYYAYCVEFNRLKAEYRKGAAVKADPKAAPSTHHRSALALQAMEKRLQEMEVMREHLASKVEEPKQNEFKLFNGSLVASFFATFELLDKDLPKVWRYVPQDFAHDLPLKGASFEPPIIVFRD